MGKWKQYGQRLSRCIPFAVEFTVLRLLGYSLISSLFFLSMKKKNENLAQILNGVRNISFLTLDSGGVNEKKIKPHILKSLLQ